MYLDDWKGYRIQKTVQTYLYPSLLIAPNKNEHGINEMRFEEPRTRIEGEVSASFKNSLRDFIQAYANRFKITL